jgi:hypothetical protein
MSKARDIASAAPAPSTVSATELGYVDGVTSAIQTQLDAKLATATASSTYIPKTLTTTTGDIIYASSANTPARLGIGSTNQVLKVTGGVPVWATASSGAMTKVTSASFSDVASVTVDECFTSTYKNYVIRILVHAGGNGESDFYFRCRQNNPLETVVSGYSGGAQRIIRSGTVSNMASDNISQAILTTNVGGGTNSASGYVINVTGFTASTERPQFSFIGVTGDNNTVGMFSTGGFYCDAGRIHGFNIRASTGNITGDYQVYGLEN